MKKVLLLAVVALFVMMPFASFAMTTISDSDMSAITAQEGVSIYLNNLTVDTNLTNMTLSWGQSSINPTDFNNNALFTNGGYFGAIVSLQNLVIGVNGLITIDVGTNPVAMAQYASGTLPGSTGLGGIAIGLDALKLNISGLNMSMVVRAGAEQTLSTPGSYLTMGTAYVGIGSLTTTINGQIVISTH